MSSNINILIQNGKNSIFPKFHFSEKSVSVFFVVLMKYRALASLSASYATAAPQNIMTNSRVPMCTSITKWYTFFSNHVKQHAFLGHFYALFSRLLYGKPLFRDAEPLFRDAKPLFRDAKPLNGTSKTPVFQQSFSFHRSAQRPQNYQKIKQEKHKNHAKQRVTRSF